MVASGLGWLWGWIQGHLQLGVEISPGGRHFGEISVTAAGRRRSWFLGRESSLHPDSVNVVAYPGRPPCSATSMLLSRIIPQQQRISHMT